MTNRNFGETTYGPATPEGPSVDDLRRSSRSTPGETFSYREKARVTDHAVTDGAVVNDGTHGEISDADMEAFRQSATARHRAQAPDLRSYTERRDPVTLEVIRTYADGRAETVADEDRGRRSRPQ
ncbi:hypothetical protein ADK91_32815 [Streptomyces sp. XY511]|uniref:hypothetical protein n=1 Tax=Streptomyces sp. XY511 TaxID=1519480 RepID=UPI0006AFA347|nr:hypothetical protein [Streptomyces sp. XY511]KOU97415.1 hypothetical protein ADK91_32815 [Streptomyces sp. XY511]